MARVTKWKSSRRRPAAVGAGQDLAHVGVDLGRVRGKPGVSDINRPSPMPWLLTSPSTMPGNREHGDIVEVVAGVALAG